MIARALSRLPDHFHQLLVLRELEGLSYRELSEVIGIPMGTVMSRLSRAREALRSVLDTELPQPGLSSRPDSREQEADAVPGVNRVDHAKGTGKSRWKCLRFPQRSRQIHFTSKKEIL